MVHLLDTLPALLLQAADTVGTAIDAAPGAVDAATAEQTLQSPWLAWVEQYGAWFIFVAFIVCGIGLHISEDFLLIPAGIAIYHGSMSWSETLVAAYFGLILGDTGWIWVCRKQIFITFILTICRRVAHPEK